MKDGRCCHAAARQQRIPPRGKVQVGSSYVKAAHGEKGIEYGAGTAVVPAAT